ncbi:r2 protein [Lasius niger]|uniref:R2 protein n=1 Tax=Lasius niger TaxID=67767 RepID=A0A0J7KB93_LASNI|nr:r2 protein [Lasius niger]
MVYTELRKRGMALSIEKCSAFQYVPRLKTWYVKDPEMVVGGIPILYGEPDKAFKYLGASATPWKGLIEGVELNTIQDLIDRVKTLPIKPMQKLTLLRTYLLPRFTHGLVTCPPPKETLRNIDSIIRSGVKRILHLHETTNSAFMYCDVAVPRASAEFLPTRVRQEIPRTVPQSPERRFVIVLILSPIRFYFYFFMIRANEYGGD